MDTDGRVAGNGWQAQRDSGEAVRHPWRPLLARYAKRTHANDPPSERVLNRRSDRHRALGLAFSFDARRPPGARLTSVTVGDAPLEDGRTYTLATNDFLARGGDDYRLFRAGEALVNSASGELMAGQLIDHIVAAGTVAPTIEGRIARED